MQEKNVKKINGLFGVVVLLLLAAGTIFFSRDFILNENVTSLVLAILLILGILVVATGLTIIQPNQAKVFTLFRQLFRSH